MRQLLEIIKKILKLLFSEGSNSSSTVKVISKPKPKYEYQSKAYVMTEREGKLFRRLNLIMGDRCYVFPQIHLDSLLNHKMRGQDWRAALSVVQRKSVDFVLVDRTTLRTICAIELDDSTHSYQDRVGRDDLVNQLLFSAGVKLVRLGNVESMSDDELASILSI